MWWFGVLVFVGFSVLVSRDGRTIAPAAPPPKPVSQWTSSDVANWVRSIGPSFELYAASFDQNGIHGPALRTITPEVLTKLGVADLHQHRLLTDAKALV